MDTLDRLARPVLAVLLQCNAKKRDSRNGNRTRCVGLRSHQGQTPAPAGPLGVIPGAFPRSRMTTSFSMGAEHPLDRHVFRACVTYSVLISEICVQSRSEPLLASIILAGEVGNDDFTMHNTMQPEITTTPAPMIAAIPLFIGEPDQSSPIRYATESNQERWNARTVGHLVRQYARLEIFFPTPSWPTIHLEREGALVHTALTSTKLFLKSLRCLFGFGFMCRVPVKRGMIEPR